MGYVAVSISYRLGIDDFFLEESLQEAVDVSKMVKLL